MWEDPGNSKGGKWVIRLRKNKIDRAWENVCMAMLGEQFLVGPEICGVVLSTRFPVSVLLFFYISYTRYEYKFRCQTSKLISCFYFQLLFSLFLDLWLAIAHTSDDT